MVVGRWDSCSGRCRRDHCCPCHQSRARGEQRHPRFGAAARRAGSSPPHPQPPWEFGPLRRLRRLRRLAGKEPKASGAGRHIGQIPSGRRGVGGARVHCRWGTAQGACRRSEASLRCSHGFACDPCSQRASRPTAFRAVCCFSSGRTATGTEREHSVQVCTIVVVCLE